MARLAIASGVFFMLLGSYLDNSRGPLLPELTRSLALTYGQVSQFLVVGFVSAILTSLGLLRWGHRISDRNLAASMAVVAALACVASSFVRDLWMLLVLGTLIGVAISGLGAVSNFFVLSAAPDSWKARLMCLLHAMYGIGSFVAPGVVGWASRKSLPWNTVFLAVAPSFLAAALLTRRLSSSEHERQARPSLHFSSTQWGIVAVLCCYVAGEVLASTWMVAFLVEARGMALADATPYATAFFLMMGFTRLACVFPMGAARERAILVGSLVLALGCFVGGRLGPAWLLVGTGLFGPHFPLFLARLGRIYPKQIRSLTLAILCAMQVTLCGFHTLVGRLTDAVGIGVAYWLPAGLLAANLAGLVVYLSQERAVT